MEPITISRICLGELEAYTASEEFLTLPMRPISSLRVRSYLNNPHAQAKDVVLYLAFMDGGLAGFRSVLPDRLEWKGSTRRVAWLSGVWVAPRYRKKGLAARLLAEAGHDWGWQLLSTNQAPHASKLLESSGKFHCVKQITGIRYYRRWALAQILPHRFPVLQNFKPLLKLVDGGFNLLHDVKWIFYRRHRDDFTAETVEFLNENDWSFLRNMRGVKLSRNALIDWQWILSFPWADTSEAIKIESGHYPFTCWAPDFSSGPVRLLNRRGEHIGIIWLLRKNGHLRIPYLWHSPGTEEIVVAFLNDLMYKQRISTITVFYPQITVLMNKWKYYFLHKKSQAMTIYAGEGLLAYKDLLSEKLEYGDGDLVMV